jgi:integrase
MNCLNHLAKEINKMAKNIINKEKTPRGIIARTLKNGTTVYDVNVGYKDQLTGRWKLKWQTAKSLGKAKLMRAKLMTEIDKSGYTKPSQLTVKLFMQNWQEILKSTSAVKPKTQAHYEYLTRVHVLPTLGNVRLCQLRTNQIQTLYTQKSEEGKISPRTIEMIHVCLHKALVYAMKTGILSRNPMDAVVKPKSERHEMKPVNEHALNMFLDEAKSTEYYALDATYELTGIRRNEGLALPWGNVDLTARTLTITRTMDFKKEMGKPAVITYSTPKTKSSRRTLDLCQINCSILAIHRKKQDEARAYIGLPPTTDDDLVFCHTDGSPYLPCTISHHWNKITRRCGLEGVRLHDIRHSYASILGKQGVPLKVIQEKLGHSSPTFTASQYMHLFSGMGRAASDVFEKALMDSRNQEASAVKETPGVQIS